MFSFLGQLDVRTIKNTHVVGGMASSRLGYNHYCTGQDGKDAMNILEKGIDAEEFLAKSKACINRGLKTGMWYRFVKHFVKKNQDKICTLWRPTLESNVQNTIPGAMSIEGETTAFNSLERHEDSISPFEVLQHFAQKAIENRPEADMERERAVEFMEVVRAINQVCQNVNTESGEELLTDYGKGAFEHPKDALDALPVHIWLLSFQNCSTVVKEVWVIFSARMSKQLRVIGWMDTWHQKTKQ